LEKEGELLVRNDQSYDGTLVMESIGLSFVCCDGVASVAFFGNLAESRFGG
jgi:hypothetical protein